MSIVSTKLTRADHGRRMSLAEIESAKPLRLQVVTVGPSDTVEKLAMPLEAPSDPLEQPLNLGAILIPAFH